jgi:N-methylhydantoinase A
MSYILGVDVGGTFTDSVCLDSSGQITFGKALSTPPEFTQGLMDALQDVAGKLGLTLGELLGKAILLHHGTTIAENAVITRNMAEAGLITTRGFEDILYLQRGAYGRWSGLPEDAIKHPVMTDKPPTLIPRNRIFGVRERTDYKGEIIAPIDAKEIEAAGNRFLDDGIGSIGVCFLWSFHNPENEARVAEILRTKFSQIRVTLSHELAPFLGEYERVSTVALNASLYPIVAAYLEKLVRRLSELGFHGNLLIVQGYGGLVPPDLASRQAVGAIESGPAAGVIGSQFLAHALGMENVIACDMGGTSFKVGVITGGSFDYATESLIERYHYSTPKIDIASIGSGGGSILWIDPRTQTPKIGPQSAGSSPGPVCYNLGGEEPTVTDVDLLLGYIDPEYFLGGRMKLNVNKTEKILREKIAKPLGLQLEEASARGYELVCSQISDLLHKVTVERGLDPREYVLFAYGGASGMHAVEFSRELNVRKVIIPFTASVHGAFGAASSDVSHEHITTRQMTVPPDISEVNAILEKLEENAISQLVREGFAQNQIRTQRSIALKFRLQVYALETPILKDGKLTEKDMEEVYSRFQEMYEKKHGSGSAYKDAGMEIVSFRLKGIGAVTKPSYQKLELRDENFDEALIGTRQAIFSGTKVNAMYYNFDLLKPGNVVRGPSIILTPVTTIVIPKTETAQMDEYRNVLIEISR